MDLSATNGRDSTKTIEAGRGYDDEGDKVSSESEITNEPMKTMADLAAEHAEWQRQLELGSSKGSKLSRRNVRPSRARQKAADDESEDELGLDEDGDISEPSLSDYVSNSPAPGRQDRSSTKPTAKARRKRARSPEVDEGADLGRDGSSRLKSASTGPPPGRKAATRETKTRTRATRTVSGSTSTSIAVPASDRVLRSRKARV